MIKPIRVLCKRTEIVGDENYEDKFIGRINRDNRVLVKGDWYDIVYSKYDSEKTFSIIDNQEHLHLFYMYGSENDNNHSLPRTYAKWFYTNNELRKMKIKRLHGQINRFIEKNEELPNQ